MAGQLWPHVRPMVCAALDRTDLGNDLGNLLNRLLKKGAVAADKDGRRFLYRPTVSRQDYVQSESQGLLDRLFDGRLAPLVSHLSQRQALSDEDIAELKRLVEDLDNGR